MAARSFSRSTLPGRERGRPTEAASGGATAGPSNQYAKARVAAARWKSKQQRQSPANDRPFSSEGRSNGALINQARGVERAETRFEHGDTRQFKRPD